MKKLLVVTGLVLSSMMSFGQYTNLKGMDWNLYYGINKTLGFEMNVLRNDNISIGGGMVLPISTDAKGVEYKTMGPNRFPQDIYEKKSGSHVGLYGIVGYNYNKILVSAKLGFYTKENYYNAYDRMGILSPSGYYHTTTDAGMSGLVGISVSYKVKEISPYVGFDNLSGVSLGIVYSLIH